MSAHVEGCRYDRSSKAYQEIGEGCCAPEAHVWWLFQAYLRCRSALLAVSTDNAQDALEDPMGHADRERAGFYRIGLGAMNAVRAALGPRAGEKT